MSQVVAKTVLTGCLAPIDKDGLSDLIAKGKADPKAIKTLKCKTVAEGRFRHLKFIRSLPPYIVDEPPGLLGDDTARNPWKPRSPRSAPAWRSAFMPTPWPAASLFTGSRSNSRPINITAVWEPAICRRSRSASPTCAPR